MIPDKLAFGTIVLLKFPFTNSQISKRRPALVINDSEDGDIVVCRITSKPYDTSFDVTVENWDAAGLKLPSVIRVHKIATLEKTLVESVMGVIPNKVKNSVIQILPRLTE